MNIESKLIVKRLIYFREAKEPALRSAIQAFLADYIPHFVVSTYRSRKSEVLAYYPEEEEFVVKEAGAVCLPTWRHGAPPRVGLRII